jgi:murein DD-endopeptidase MepM/ murein hydrolase activator NlpD
MHCPVGALACALAAIPAKAPELGLPLACIPGADCWAVRYVDHDTGPTAADYSCGVLSSDGHDGTDVAIADPARMREGVPVLAVANGTVRRVRDGVADQPAHGRLDHDFAGLNCGNGVVVEHAGGWETQYCHLRSGSVRVGPGQSVAAGQAIGLVGMSGEANFPHVHLSVRRDGVAIDPFTGGAMTEPCGQPGAPLWRQDLRAELTYLEVPIAVVGLTDRVPSRDEIVAGTAASDTLRAASPALVHVQTACCARGGRSGQR